MHLVRTALYCAVFLSAFGVCGPALSAPSMSDSTPLKCESGPISKTFGRSQWLVYGCVDGRSMVAVSAPGSPSSPFYFMVFEGQNGYEVVGEGKGSQAATAAAYSDLKALSAQEIKALIAEAGRGKK